MVSYTASARFTLQVTGTNNNTWGNILNSGVFELVDSAINGRVAFSLSGARVLTTVNGATDEARNAIIDITGGTGGTITIPSVSKVYIVRNNSAGVVTVTTGGVTNAMVGAGDVGIVMCDASAVYPLKLAGYALKDYIDQAILATTGSLPAALGNDGKILQVVAGAWVPTSASASAPVVRLGTATTSFLSPGDTYNAFAEVTLTSASNSIANDMAAYINAVHALTENTTLANPSNPKVGQSGFIRIVQNASSAKTLAMGSSWKRSGGALPVSTTLSATDILVYEVITSTLVLYDLIKNPT